MDDRAQPGLLAHPGRQDRLAPARRAAAHAARWEVRDLGSLNGTRVNGWRVAHARLEDGDELRLGDVVVQLTGR